MSRPFNFMNNIDIPILKCIFFNRKLFSSVKRSDLLFHHWNMTWLGLFLFYEKLGNFELLRNMYHRIDSHLGNKNSYKKSIYVLSRWRDPNVLLFLLPTSREKNVNAIPAVLVVEHGILETRVSGTHSTMEK